MEADNERVWEEKMDISDDDGAQKSKRSRRKRKLSLKNDVESTIKKHCPSNDLPKRSENEEKDVFAGLSKEYRVTSGMKDTFHGTFYQVKIIFLFLKRAIDLKCNFRLATEMDAAEKFDDLVFEFRNENNDIECRALQAKHKQNEDDKITLKNLLDQKEGDFSLKKYFISYLVMKRNVEFEKMEVKDFIIMTNIDFEEKSVKNKGILMVRNESDPALDFRFKYKNPAKVPVRYRINPSKEMINILKECSEMRLLAKKLDKCVFGEPPKKLTLFDFKYYHVALCEHVIDKSARTFKPDFVSGKNLPDEVKQFRDLFLTFDLNMNQKLSRATNISLAESFGVKAANKPDEQHLDLPKDKLGQKEIDDFFEKLIFAVYQPNEEELGQLIEEEIGEELNLSYSKDVADQVLVRLLDWFKSKTGTFLYPESKSFFDEPKQILSSRVTIGLVMKYAEKLKAFAQIIRFKEPQRQTLIQFLNNESHRKYLIQSDEPLLTLIKMYQCINEHETYKKVDNYVVINLTLLMYKTIQNNVIQAFGSESNANLLVIHLNYSQDKLNENEKAVTHLFCELSSKLKNPSKKLLIVIKKEINLPEEFSKKFTFETKSNETKFNDLSKKSQKRLLDKKVNFLGNEMRLGEFSRDKSAWNAIIDSNVIVKLIEGENEMHEIGRAPMRLCELEAAYAKRLKVIAPEQLVNSFKKTANKAISELYVISGIDENDKDAFDTFIQLLKVCDESDKQTINDCTQIFEANNVNFKKYKKINILKSDEEASANLFKNFCCCNSNKLVYWVEIKDENFRLLQIYDPDFYIKRNLFHHKVIKNEAVINLIKDERFVLSGTDFNGINKVLKIDFQNFHLTNKSESNSEIEKLESKFKENVFASVNKKNAIKKFDDWCSSFKGEKVHLLKGEKVHLLKVSDGKLIWQRSHSSLSRLRDYIDENANEQIDERALANLNDKVVVVVAEPGMGKSTTLTRLSEYKLGNSWVIRLNLKDYQDDILKLPLDYTEIDKATESVLQFLLKVSRANGKNAFTHTLLKYSLNHQTSQPLLILFDGYDEINDYCQLRLIPLMNHLKENTYSKLWITSRKHFALELENKLCVFSTTFKELSLDERVQFLKNFWQVRLKLELTDSAYKLAFKSKVRINKFQIFSEALLAKVDEILDETMSKFMGIPLQLRLLAEGFLPEFEKYIEGESVSESLPFDRLDVSQIYQQFIRVKYFIYYREKTGLSIGLNEESEKWFSDLNKLHQKLALKLLFPDKIRYLFKKADFSIANNFTLNLKDEMKLKRVGLVHSTLHSDQLEFIHRTFAEYFVAEPILKWLRKPVHDAKFEAVEHLLKIILSRDYQVICTFLNKQITEADLITVKSGNFSKYILEDLNIDLIKNNVMLIKFILSFFKTKFWLFNQYLTSNFLSMAISYDESAEIVTYFLSITINHHDFIRNLLLKKACQYDPISCEYQISIERKIDFRSKNVLKLIRALTIYPAILKDLIKYYNIEDLCEMTNNSNLKQFLRRLKFDDTDKNATINQINKLANCLKKTYKKYATEMVINYSFYSIFYDFATCMFSPKELGFTSELFDVLTNIFEMANKYTFFGNNFLTQFLKKVKKDRHIPQLIELLKKYESETEQCKTSKICLSSFGYVNKGKNEVTERMFKSYKSNIKIFVALSYYDDVLRPCSDKKLSKDQENFMFFLFDYFKKDPIISMHFLSVCFTSRPKYVNKLLASVKCRETKTLMNHLLGLMNKLNFSLNDEKLEHFGTNLLEKIKDRDIKTLQDILNIPEQDANVKKWIKAEMEIKKINAIDFNCLKHLLQSLAYNGNFAFHRDVLSTNDVSFYDTFLSWVNNFPALFHLLFLKYTYSNDFKLHSKYPDKIYSILEFLWKAYPETACCLAMSVGDNLHTLLHFALNWNDPRLMGLLFKIFQPYPNILGRLVVTPTKDSKSCLHRAIINSNVDTLKLFLANLIRVDNAMEYVVANFVSDEEDKLNLFQAAQISDHSDSLVIFLNSLKVNEDVHKSFILPVDKSVKPAFYLAVERGCEKVVKLMLSHLKSEPEILRQLVFWSDTGSDSGTTVLHRAAEKGYIEIVEALLHSGFHKDITCRMKCVNILPLETLLLREDKSGHTALDCAILRESQIFEKKIRLRLRRKLFCNPDYKTFKANFEYNGRSDIQIESLRKLAPDLNKVPMVVKLILVFAKRFNNVELMLAILENENLKSALKSIRVTLTNYSYHLFHCAIKRNDVGLMKLLIEKGVDVDATNGYGYTALMKVAQKNNTSLAQELVTSGGADIFKRDMNGISARSIAINEGNLSNMYIVLNYAQIVKAKD